MKNLFSEIEKLPVLHTGMINFASKGIDVSLDGLIKAFDYGFALGVACAKAEFIKGLNKSLKRQARDK